VSADSVFYSSNDDEFDADEDEFDGLRHAGLFDRSATFGMQNPASKLYADRETTSTPFDNLPLPLRYVISAMWWGNTVLEVDEGSAGELILTTRKSCFPSFMVACSSLFHCGVCRTERSRSYVIGTDRSVVVRIDYYLTQPRAVVWRGKMILSRVVPEAADTTVHAVSGQGPPRHHPRTGLLPNTYRLEFVMEGGPPHHLGNHHAWCLDQATAENVVGVVNEFLDSLRQSKVVYDTSRGVPDLSVPSHEQATTMYAPYQHSMV